MTSAVIEETLHQMCVAFGQGTGALAVSKTAARMFTAHYRRLVDMEMATVWGMEGGHVERLRTLGRTAAEAAVRRGAAEISAFQLQQAMGRVAGCEGRSGSAALPELPATETDGLPEIFAEIAIAFGQGSGLVPVGRHAVRILRAFADRFLAPEWRADWDQARIEVLETMRLLGRLAAREAAAQGNLKLEGREVADAGFTILQTSPDDLRRVAESRLRAVLRRERTYHTLACHAHGGHPFA